MYPLELGAPLHWVGHGSDGSLDKRLSVCDCRAKWEQKADLGDTCLPSDDRSCATAGTEWWGKEVQTRMRIFCLGSFKRRLNPRGPRETERYFTEKVLCGADPDVGWEEILHLFQVWGLNVPFTRKTVEPEVQDVIQALPLLCSVALFKSRNLYKQESSPLWI